METELFKTVKTWAISIGVFVFLLYVSLLIWGDAGINFGILEYSIISLCIILILAALLLKQSLKTANQLLFLGLLIFILVYFRNYSWTVFFWIGFICNQYAKLNYNYSLRDLFWKLEEWYNRKTE